MYQPDRINPSSTLSWLQGMTPQVSVSEAERYLATTSHPTLVATSGFDRGSGFAYSAYPAK